MNTLKLTSCMAPNADDFVKSLAEYLTNRLNIHIEACLDIPWQERELGFDAGDIEICWICGLPYIWKVDKPAPQVELLATPVLKGRRYRNRAVYYSDVVVHKDSPIRKFADLEGMRWSYNEPQSHSGTYVVRDHLAKMGKDCRYFGKIVESGAHQNSIQMILDNRIDASAIDSWVLELEMIKRPELASKLRVIDTLGPSSFPPWMISRLVPVELRRRIKHLLVEMHQDPIGRSILDKVEISHFSATEDRDYDPIRKMAQSAEKIEWAEI
ncbi:PhnD/SsuA/transferrin family substrate-binding protein [Shewanella psychropiezotolerans]|uniref:PhnD/SsuA/transferrin family substrate-binding protein n=1 Tax=Shewanella psychropiezotolerans TaxID=2593655 RepID=A0ABX5X3I1_9GAMM|nr:MULTISPECIES: PhnD/SsuA/transferrin family substrate-binding protein [Shewanella]MPY21046.1 PhnD/SsuA/transferrin family substrate-binding protein [Shewanella sp. YLB-07]MPY21833.1 PhnD/SsuA/transferrin family substrate-binding protein [Shewanella sp. YLB-07]QDO85277.1 PhnD/SsuA/transferrin family substrate-binding protein [Shewanella psychropiezotolerans]